MISDVKYHFHRDILRKILSKIVCQKETAQRVDKRIKDFKGCLKIVGRKKIMPKNRFNTGRQVDDRIEFLKILLNRPKSRFKRQRFPNILQNRG